MKEFPPGASCREMPLEAVDEYFFEAPLTNSRAKIEMAKRICGNCIVRDECFEMAMDELPPYGIFAGLTPRERDRLLTGGAA